MKTDSWIDAGAAADLSVAGAKLLRHDGRQYALFRTAENELFACDNACPHEGYPLLQGYTDGCVLTCAWHNFKFDLRDGNCVVGEEDLGVYPLRERNGRLEVDLTPKRGADHEAKLWQSLESALHENRLAQAARDAARLLACGVAAGRIAAFAAAFDGRHAPWGSSHALPVAADLLRYFERANPDPLLPLMQVLELAAESGHLRVPHASVAPHVGGGDADALRAELLQAIESERMEDAEAVLRAAAAAGILFAELEAWLLESCCTHFLGFGHQLIYLSKVSALREHSDSDTYLEILIGLLRNIVYGTREDTLPPMSATRRSLEEHRGRFPEWMRRQAAASTATDAQLTSMHSAVLDGRASEVPTVVVELLEQGIDRHEIARELVIAAAERVLRFDPSIELDSGLRENWLHVTHTMTFASAVRSILKQTEAESSLALLFHAAHFIHHKKPLDRPDQGAEARSTATTLDSPTISARVLSGNREAALLALHDHLEHHGIDPGLAREIEDLVMQHPAVRPIRVAHVLKTLLIGLEESRSLGDDPRAALPLAAALAFASARMDERGMARIAREAGDFVGEGRPPRRLTS